MPLAYLTRFIRKKVVLGVILGLSVCYCLVSFYYDHNYPQGSEIDSIPLRNLDSFLWHTGQDDERNSSNRPLTCRNSVQGKILMVDDRGYICSRFNILPSGCCDRAATNVARYSCDTCRENGCCSIYEYCISCCLNPDKKELLQGVLSRAPAAFHVVFASVTDHYELCLAKCRTSSLSVQHENSYRDPKAKHCYGDALPPYNQPV